jgi:hypothetical protein
VQGLQIERETKGEAKMKREIQQLTPREFLHAFLRNAVDSWLSRLSDDEVDRTAQKIKAGNYGVELAFRANQTEKIEKTFIMIERRPPMRGKEQTKKNLVRG